MTYPSATHESTNHIIQTKDGGLLLAGATDIHAVIAGSRDMLLLKTDCDGAVEWTSGYGDSLEDKAVSVVEAANGDFIVVGFVGAADRDIALLRTDAMGNEIWRRVLVNPGDDIAMSVCQADAGSFLLCAGRTGALDEDAYVLKFDSLGATIWENSFDLGRRERFNELAFDGEKVWLAGRKVGGPVAEERGLVYCLDGSSGAQLFAYESPWVMHYFSLCPHPAGGFVAAGKKRNGSSFVLGLERVDTSGNSLWTKAHSIVEESWGMMIIEAADAAYSDASPAGGTSSAITFLVAGTKSNLAGSEAYGWLASLNETGDLLEERSVNQSGADIFRGMTLAEDGSLVAAGEAGSFFGGNADNWWVRILPDLEYCQPIAGTVSLPDSLLLGTELAVVTSGFEVAKWLWNTGDSSAAISATTSGWYQCYCFDTAGCYLIANAYVNVFEEQVSATTNLASAAGKTPLLYPNPSNGYFKVLPAEKSTLAWAQLQLEICDLQGALLQTIDTQMSSTVQPDQLAAGFYLVRVNFVGSSIQPLVLPLSVTAF